jgi:hypothetical protein
MGRRRRQGNITPQKINSSIKESVENEYPVADPSHASMTWVISMSNEKHV